MSSKSAEKSRCYQVIAHDPETHQRYVGACFSSEVAAKAAVESSGVLQSHPNLDIALIAHEIDADLPLLPLQDLVDAWNKKQRNKLIVPPSGFKLLRPEG